MNVRGRHVIFILIWILTLAWLLRIVDLLFGPTTTAGFGAMNDWSRLQIVTTGHLNAPKFSPPTKQASLLGGTADNWTTFLTGILSIVLGGEVPFGQLRRLHLVPLVGLVLFPAAVGVWVNQVTAGGITKWRHPTLFLVLALAAIPTVGEMISTSSLISRRPYASVLLLLATVQLPKIHSNPRRWIVFVILLFGIFTAHHTLILVSFIIFSMYYGLRILHPEGISRRRLVFQGGVLVTVFFVAGTRLNSGVHELVIGLLANVFSTGSSVHFATAQQNFGESVQLLNDQLPDLARKVAKVGYRIGYFVVVVTFVTTVAYRLWRHQRENLSETTLALLFIIGAFPAIFFGTYSFGGIPGTVGRTEAYGVYFAIIALGWLSIRGPDRIRSHVPQVTIALILLVSIAFAAHPATFDTPHTNSEVEGIRFAGTEVPEDRYVFTDARLGYTLMYFNYYRFVNIRPQFDQSGQLYEHAYNGTTQQRQRAIQTTIRRSSFERVNEVPYYVLVSEQMGEKGVSFLTFSVPYPDSTVSDGFDRSFTKVYDSGDGYLYVAEWSDKA